MRTNSIQIKCGSLLVNDLQVSTKLYSELLEQEIVEQGELSEILATSWGAPRLAGAKTCLLQPKSKADSYIRLIQSPDIVTPIPHATSYGWTAFEICVEDVFALADKLQGSGFSIVGPPKHLDGMTNVIPMQVVGPDQEVLFLNQVLESDSHTDLPIAQSVVDRIFIAVLATNDRQSSVLDYAQQLACQEAGTYELRYSLINRAFDLDMETKHSLTLVQDGRKPLLEIDQYPAEAKERMVKPGNISHGNAIVSLLVDDLDTLPLRNKVSEHTVCAQGLLYEGRRSIMTRGAAGELLELIEKPSN